MLSTLPKFALVVTPDVLEGVGEGLPAQADAVRHHRKALVEQDDGGRLLGDIDRGVDRDADVGGVQRGGVVDPVAEEADDVAIPQGPDDAFLVQRLDLCEHDRGFRVACAGLVASSPPARYGRTVPGSSAEGRGRG